MKLSNLLRTAFFGLVIGLAGACSNEELQQSAPNTGLNLNDGETLVTINLNGIGGTVASRALPDENITLPGEVEIKKLDLYSFVAPTSSSSVADYELERVYHYKALGSTNDLALTPVGDAYQASFGIDMTQANNRYFMLIANDSETRTVTTIADVSGGGGGTATKVNDVSGWNILETALVETAKNIGTPLPMTGIVGRTEYNNAGESVQNNIYTPEDIKGGAALKAELVRQVARIDIRNVVATGIKVTKVKLTGAGNAALFPTDVASAATGIAFEDKDIAISTEMIPGALYAYPIKGDGTNDPTVTVTGMLGTQEISVDAKFNPASFPTGATEVGMYPNTRYIVNLHNSEGNITADITIKEWNPGETVDTDDVMEKLNAAATLEAVTDNSTLEEKVLYIDFEGTTPSETLSDADTKIATITGKDGDTKPIGIILPEDCDWLKVEDKTASGGKASYELHVIKANDTHRPRTAKLSLVTYKDSKQVVNEYIVHQDYLNLSEYTGAYEDIQQIWGTSDATAGNAPTICYLPPFANLLAFNPVGNDFIIEEGCTWLSLNTVTANGIDGKLISISDNIGKPERRATVTLRRWDGTAGAADTPHTFTVVQSGTVDKSFLAETAEIILAKGAVLDETTTPATIIADAAADAAGKDPVVFSVQGPMDTMGLTIFRPVLVTFDTKDNFLGAEADIAFSADGTKWGYSIDITVGKNTAAGAVARTTHFTVTTYVNGAPVVKKYRLIQKAPASVPGA